MWSSDTTTVRRKASDKAVSKFHISLQDFQDLDPLRRSRISESSTSSPLSQLTPTSRPRGVSPVPGRAVPGHFSHSSSSSSSSLAHLSRPISTARFAAPTTVAPSAYSLPRRAQSPKISTPKSHRIVHDGAREDEDTRLAQRSSTPSSSLPVRSSQSTVNHHNGRPRYETHALHREQENTAHTVAKDRSGSASASVSSIAHASANASAIASASASSSGSGTASKHGPLGFSAQHDSSDPVEAALRRWSIGEQQQRGSRRSGSGSGNGSESRAGSSDEARGLVGLSNLGNTCFLNSCLQCLSHTPPLLAAALATPADTIRGNLSRAFVAVVRALWNQAPNTVFSPRSLLACLEDVAPQFSGYRQHDSQELLRALLEQLDMEQNRVDRKAPYRELATDGFPEDILARDAWDYHRSRHNSIIQDAFCGQLQSTIECGSCRGRSHCFDPFLDLSLPIPKHLNRRVTLHDCISVFASQERLDGCDKYHCSKCKGPRPCIKQLRIFRLPTILVLHLKRFCGARFSLFSKDTTVVHFPLNNLDLTEFLADGGRGGGGGGGGGGVYDLYAVSNHCGSLGSGHYTAVCKNRENGCWYTYNDSNVSLTSEASIVTSSAYLLFYQRRLSS